MIRIIGPKDKRESGAINTTSTSRTWSRELSPMVLGPVEMYNDLISQTVENAWQYSKVYPGQTMGDWTNWAGEGFRNPRGVRYPMGRGAVPLYSHWNGQKLNYLEARKQIYVPMYRQAVLKSSAFYKLEGIYLSVGQITLFDFDGYDYQKLGMTLEDVLNEPKRKMGHAFVLAMLLSR